MIRAASLTLFASLPAALTFSQTTPTVAAHRATTAHHTAASAPTPAVNPADNPPGVPPVTATPKPLYALRYVDLVVGTGPLAPSEKFYTVKYTGWLTDGTKFDSSYDHPGQESFTFPYGAHRVIPGWDTGFSGMHVGGKRRLYIPYQLAYGEAGREGAIPPKADLIFDLELVSFSDTPPAAAAPPPPPAESQPQSQPAPGETSEPGAAPPQNPPQTPPNPSETTPSGSSATPPSTNPK